MGIDGDKLFAVCRVGKMTQKQAAMEIVKRLRKKGFTALFAGGCVRDMLLGRMAKDYDVATNATPGDVCAIFSRTLEVGAQFGVVVVMMNGAQVEVATFRTESGYVDGRHPSHVEFADAKEDASRRDFTINGMFYDPLEEKVIDFVGGREDIEKRVIRTIGEPAERFGEDYLRMLRAIRFSAQLGFEIDGKTFEAINAKSSYITKISGERIAMELDVTLTNPNRKYGCQKLLETGLLHAIFPKVGEYQAVSGIEVLGQLRKNGSFAFCVAALWSHTETDRAMEQLEVLKLSRDQYKHIEYLLKNRGKLREADMSVSTLKRLAANPYFRDLFDLHKAMMRAGGEAVSSLTKLKLRLRDFKGVELAPRPLLNGHELISIGAVPGPEVGELMEEIYIQQLEGSVTDKEHARLWAADWLKKRED